MAREIQVTVDCADPAALAATRSAAVDQHVSDPGPPQFVELLGDIVGSAIHRADAVDGVGVAGGAVGSAMDGAVGPRRELQLPHPVCQTALQRALLFLFRVADKEGAGDADRERIETPPTRLDGVPVRRDRAADIGRRCVLPEQQLVTGFRDPAG